MDIVFDIETTGLPPRDADWETDYAEFPHIVQLAWIVGDKENDYLIKPDGYEISAEMTAIHGTSHDKAVKEGHKLVLVLKAFLFDAQNCENLIGHNVNFDTSVIKANLIRCGLGIEQFNEILHKDKRFDTMMKSMKVMGVSKWPKLGELYQFLFNKDIENQHNAFADIKATLECYDELKKRGVESLKSN